ncbi:formiminoglutamate deiminase [Ancylobacter novellus DSM 506]|uniref:Formiminoglutamate deiminase n=1 Tax=Ancylobacter novellus (strain ATCC 8093 / DSM 506 / JCM 20403 / CCM 1077 / IAM 12100 / NBRC 12443 / NCIMB 10456) TaxID=639283 RepID=D7AA49_ANCN5|nr:formimidoylglutamate deiminase [Ancylobacter novellus]ADH90836.1 formiminoglutamate deiminase [Ancylobacter novellus DSM 506]
MTRLWFESAFLATGWAKDVAVTIENGVITALVPGSAPTPGDERHALALPGLPNLHSHAFQRAFAGATEVRGPTGDSFWTWREAMYRAVDRMDPEDVEAIAAQAYVEMLEAGFTRVGEFHYLHHDRDGRAYADIGELSTRIAGAAEATGIALTLLPVFYAHSGFGGQVPSHGQRRFINDVESFGRLMGSAARAIAPLPDAVLGLAPHSLRAATVEEIAAILPLTHGPVHIHVAEQMKEVEDCLAWSGRRPVEYLLDSAPVDSRWCLIHATHMTPDETVRMARSGAIAGLCPITEANLGDGIFPAPEFVAAGGAYGVGSDSNVLIDAAGELRQLEYSQRLARRARNVLAMAEGRSTGATLFQSALAGGAQALGGTVGLAVGAPADIVSLDMRHPALEGRQGDAALDGWVFAVAQGSVDCVWRRGTKLVERGRHRDREAVRLRFRAALARIVA